MNEFSEKTSSLEDAKQIIEKQFRQDVENCQKEVQEVLNRHSCVINIIQVNTNGQNGPLQMQFAKNPNPPQQAQ